MSDYKGKLMPLGELDDMLSTTLEGIFEREPQLFPPHIQKKDDVRKIYHYFRSFRRTSDTRAIEINASDKNMDVVNR